MTHTYDISGMSCNDCRSIVEKALNTIDGIKASVTLAPPVAKISMDKRILSTVFQKTLTAVVDCKITMGNL